MTLFSRRHADHQIFNIPASMCFWFVTAAALFSPDASAQVCRGNPQIGCSHPGAKCTDQDISNGHCTTPPGAPPGERECVCKGEPVPPTPPVVMLPKYVIGALIYAPPGCNSAMAGTACSQPGLVDYSSGSSMGSKYSTADSFKRGIKITLETGTPLGGTESSFGWSRTTGDTSTESCTKSGSQEFKVPGNGDGIDHDQDMFELLLNPTVTLSSDAEGTIYWLAGFSGNGPERYEVRVSELRNPATMRPAVAAVLNGLGFTAADYKTIRCRDPFSGPGVSGPGGVRPDFCQVSATTGEASAGGLDPNRFRPTTWILPYEPPAQATDLCPSITATLKNEYASEDATSTQDEYTVSAQLHTGQGGPNVFNFQLKLEGQMTWTASETDTTSQSSTQSASLTLVCPSVSYTGPTLFQVYVDMLYGTFLFVPYDPVSMQITQHGTVTDGQGKPIAGEPITLEYGGRTYHTFTSVRGSYRFIALKRTLNKGTISIRNHKQEVPLHSQDATAIRLQ